MPSKKNSKSITIDILSRLITENESYTSGNDLAEQLNLSRTSIWGHLEKLKQEGFEFEAIRNRGYRITQLPDKIHPLLLKAYLKNLSVNLPIIFHEEIDSTNSEVERHLESNTSAPMVVVSCKQLKGRGRLGRTWNSDDSGNLYLSFGFRPNIKPQLIQSITPWMAVQMCDLFNQIYNLPIQVKWPNDLVLDKKKVCGMLAEARIDVDRTRDLVFGIGININGSTKTWDKELKKSATTFHNHSGISYNINEMAAQIIKRGLETYKSFIDNSYTKQLPKYWDLYDCLKGKRITGYQGSTPTIGKAMGINEYGHFRLLLDNGTMKILSAGEVSLSKPF